MKRYIRKLTMLDSWTAILTDPTGTMEHLLIERETPPYLIRSLVALTILLFLPAVLYQFRYDLTPTQPDVTGAFVLTIGLTFIFSVIFVGIFLRMIGVTAPFVKVLAGGVYVTVPIIPILFAYYLFNYVLVGDLSITVYLMSGRRLKGDWFLNLFPYFLWFTEFMCFVVLMSVVKALGKMGFWSSFFTAAVCSGTVMIAFLFSTVIAGAVFPDTPIVVWNYFRTLADVPEEK